MLWDYLYYVIGNWNGEVIIMGDFNEVRSSEERFGSILNKKGAEAFNSFIPLGEGLMETCPNISAITLDRKIRTWIKAKKESSNNQKVRLKDILSDIDVALDKGAINAHILRKHMNFPNSLSVDPRDDMEREVSKDEIKRAVWDYVLDESPGPDGFTFGGISSFIALIPKMQEPKMVKDFRPISLIGSLYTIIAKILENRLVSVMGHLVNEVRSAFVANRKILDGPFILDEKSKLMGIAVDDDKVTQVARSISCLTFSTSFSYLSVKVGGVMSRIQAWDGIVSKMLVRLSKRKMKTLSIGLIITRCGLGLLWLNTVRMGLLKLCLSTLRLGWILFETWKILKPEGLIYLVLLRKEWAMVRIPFLEGCVEKRDVFMSLSKRWAEFEQFTSLMASLEGYALPNFQDRWVWSLMGSGEFSVASVRRYIDDHMLPDVSSKTIWLKAVPFKVNIHAWKVKLDSLPTRFNLSRRGLDIQWISCPICDKAAKTTSHIFFSCYMVRDTYREISTWWDFHLSEVSSFEEWRVGC
nr:RNA-directed DNA polymerase, eukaryota [Tanacetum cinerariifolium]